MLRRRKNAFICDAIVLPPQRHARPSGEEEHEITSEQNLLQFVKRYKGYIWGTGSLRKARLGDCIVFCSVNSLDKDKLPLVATLSHRLCLRRVEQKRPDPPDIKL